MDAGFLQGDELGINQDQAVVRGAQPCEYIKTSELCP